MSHRNLQEKTKYGVIWCGRITDIFLFLLLSAFILISSPYEGITKTKYIVFLSLCGGYILLTTISVVELLLLKYFSLDYLKRLLYERRLLLLLAGLYLLFTAMSAIASPYKYNVWIGISRYEGLLTQILYVGVMLLISLFGQLKKWHGYVFGCTMISFCILCMIQLAGGNPFGLYPEGYNYYDAFSAYSGEYIGTIGNADLASALLAMAFAFFLVSALKCRGRDRYCALVPLLLCTITLVWIRVSAGLLSAAICIALLLPLAVTGKAVKKYILILECIVFVGCLGILYGYDFGGSGTLFEFHQLLHGTIDSSFGSSRIKIWSEVLAEMKNHIMLGTGPDSMKAWELEGFSRYVPEVGYTIHQGIDTAHNEYLNVAAQQGMLAGISYVLLLCYSVKAFCNREKITYYLQTFAVVVGYAVQAFFGFSMCMTAPIFWVFMGLLFSGEENKNANFM